MERWSTGLRNRVLRAGGKSVADTLANGVIRIYSGSQPASADAVETGTLLAVITLNSGAFAAGVATNGINFGTAADGVVSKAVGEVWSGLGIAAGTMGWYRHYANAYVTGASTTAERYDGSIGTSGTDLVFANLNVSIGGLVRIDEGTITFPAQ